MKPTPEQLEAVADAICLVIDGAPVDYAQAAWDVIAPLVLEAAAKVAVDAIKGPPRDEWDQACAAIADSIGALKDAK